ncbi:MAG: UDP-N-acetylglucosamine 1-carboxyvinyltransferase, partial [Saprospiraceae bacterium]|nr:UDP-N-acetylglucosamine 1-carboxyvinyltransferase [Saprospiraceae bacterium]
MAVNDAFEVTGGKTLSGELHPQGAKNEALQILCATLLTSEAVTIRNLPDILDIRHLIQLLGGLGVKVTRHDAHSYTFEAREVDLEYFGTEAFQDNARKIRGSVMLLAPLLARYKKAVLPKPGGDKIGRRRLDTHFLGLQKLGARFQYDEGSNRYEISAERLEGAYILMDEISVTGTANVLMAAVLARGETTIYNAACEPYIQQLCAMLCRMGARIEGIGSNLLHVHGVERLGGTEHTILPDMIEIGSFISLAAMTQSTLTIKNAGVSQLGIIPTVFERLGARIDVRGDDLHIPAQEEYAIQSFLDGSIMTIYDSPWPGFSPDLMSVLLVMAIQAKGAVLLHQKMFESRLFFVDKLIDMGAQIILCDPHRATVIGHNRRFALRGIEMTSPDIRAGVALLIAALSARGT